MDDDEDRAAGGAAASSDLVIPGDVFCTDAPNTRGEVTGTCYSGDDAIADGVACRLRSVCGANLRVDVAHVAVDGIDANTERVSRLTIAGSEIANLVTRTYADVSILTGTDPPPRSMGRRAVLLLRWLGFARKNQ